MVHGPFDDGGGFGAAGRCFSEGRVLLSADDAGLHAWDPSTGDRLWSEPGFSPARHHRAGGVLIELGEAWRLATLQ